MTQYIRVWFIAIRSRIPDGNALVELWNTVKEAQTVAQQMGQDPAQAAHQALMQNKTFKKVTGGIHHRSFEESYGQYADHAAMFTPENQGVDSSQQVDSVGDPTPDPQLMNTPLDQDLSGWAHPELHEQGWYKNLHIGGKGAIRRRVAAGQRVKKHYKTCMVLVLKKPVGYGTKHMPEHEKKGHSGNAGIER